MQDQASFGVLIILGCLAMFGLIVVIILFVVTYQRKMLEKENKLQVFVQEKQIQLFRATVEAEEKQKEKIANNLHDTINPMLSVLKMNLSKHRIDISKNKFNPDDLKKDAQIIDDTIEGIRNTCQDLIPSFLLDFGLIKSLERHTSKIAANKAIQIIFTNKQDTGELSLSQQDQLSVYRICLEIINNLLKHSRCTLFELMVNKENNNLVLQFTHNGKGIDNEDVENLIKSNKGLGLKSLKSRVLILNAQLNYIKTINTSSIVLQIPLVS